MVNLIKNFQVPKNIFNFCGALKTAPPEGLIVRRIPQSPNKSRNIPLRRSPHPVPLEAGEHLC